MGLTRTYDPAKHVFSFLSNLIADGYAKGTFIKVTPNSDSYTLEKGAAGDGVRSKVNDRSAKLELTLMSHSQANDVLAALMAADEQDSSAVGPLFLKELNGSMKVSGANAWIMRRPDIERAEASGQTTWVFEIDDADIFPGGLT